ncbi:hypothetical protein Bca4012_084086 [Brassica carinata]
MFSSSSLSARFSVVDPSSRCRSSVFGAWSCGDALWNRRVGVSPSRLAALPSTWGPYLVGLEVGVHQLLGPLSSLFSTWVSLLVDAEPVLASLSPTWFFFICRVRLSEVPLGALC